MVDLAVDISRTLLIWDTWNIRIVPGEAWLNGWLNGGRGAWG